MRSAAPRRTARRSTQTASLAPDRRASPRVSKQDGASYARTRHLSAEEQKDKDDERADAHGNLAAMCFERARVDLTADPDETKTAAEAIAGKRDFLLLANILGLDGAR